MAEKYDYNVTINHFADRPADSVAQQHFIMLEKGDRTEAGLKVTKKWIDGDNKEKRRDIKVQLYEVKDGVENIVNGKTLTLNENNNWTAEFKDLPEFDENNELIYYTIKEIVPEGYESLGINLVSGTMGSNTASYTITNVLLTDVKVVKEWDDKEDIDEYRPTSLNVTLYANGVSTGKTRTLDANNDWTATFEKLHKYSSSGEEINYTIREEINSHYENPAYDKTEGADGNTILTITNKRESHYDGYIEITGKVWEETPSGKDNSFNGIYNKEIDKDILLPNIKVRLKYIDNKGKHHLFNENLPNVYETKTDSNGEYKIIVNYDNSKNVYKLYEDVKTIESKLKTAYVEFEYDGLKYTTVANADSGENTSKAVEDEVKRNIFDSNHSKIAPEPKTLHADKWTDKNITAVTKTVASYTKGDSENRSVVVKYCNGNGTCDRTHPEGAWITIEDQSNKYPCQNCQGKGHVMREFEITVENIPNINLGLFKREQPDVAITSELSKVEAIMRGQQYTYLYNVRTGVSEEKAKTEYQKAYDDAKEKGMTDEAAKQYAEQIEMKVKFQNKDTYTYKRPVNPADIAYLQQEANKNDMSVFVTYEVKVANLSKTTPITVHNIINSYDTEYTLNTQGWTDLTNEEESKKVGYKQSTYDGDLNIIVNPLTESTPIELKYTVSIEAIRNLLNQEATLNNAVEISSYSTKYGAETLYAEHHNKEMVIGASRENKDCGGYDYNSHPGNAGIVLNTSTNRLESTKLVEYKQEDGTIKLVPEDDTDIAPSFVLLAPNEASKTLAGVVWEDTDENTNDEERLGNGYRDDEEGNRVQNVTIELYNEEGTLAKLYNEETKQLDIEAKVISDENGNYNLKGVVTGEKYFIKYTYGNNTTELGHDATTMDGGTTRIDARNYKSTIISEDIIKNIMKEDYPNYDLDWSLKHDERYSIAVDNMINRTNIGVLTCGTYTRGENMTAYTKPFVVQLEFDDSEGERQGKADVEGIVINKENELITETLNKFSFGIIERPREELIMQKTVKDIKVTLVNGQVILEGDPTKANANINYTKTMGFRLNRTIEQAKASLEKRLLIEMDQELIQGAQLDVTYEVYVINNNEIDYDYGEKEIYEKEIKSSVELGEVDQYITKNAKADYYYYGDKTGFSNEDILKSTIQFVDYLSKELVKVEDDIDWKTKSIYDLYSGEENGIEPEKNFITKDVYNKIKTGEYKILQTKNERITIERGEEFSQKMKVKKILSNNQEYIFDNNVEIIEIDGKTGRTVKAKYEDGSQLEYVPGNYVPATAQNESETDDDRVEIIITPPTGITNNVKTYLLVSLMGLIIVFVVVILIKKKSLIK